MKTVPEQIVESVRYFKFDDVKEFEIELVPKELGPFVSELPQMEKR